MKSSICAVGMTLMLVLMFQHPIDALDPICRLPPDTGLCRGRFEMYYFDPNGGGSCKTFYYGGCGGNANRFRSAAECNSACSYQAIVFPG